MSLISKIMGTTKKPTVKKADKVKKEPKAFKCANCEDSGRECYKCGAGKEITDIV